MTKTKGIIVELPPSYLCDLPTNKEILGCGSFATVRRCFYRGIEVAVKEYFTGIDMQMVQQEACFLYKLFHLNIPLLFGMNTMKTPYYIVLTNSSHLQKVDIAKGHKIVLIDFNKATEISLGKLYKLSSDEKSLYRAYHSHMAPEVIDGTKKQTTASDIFSVGKLFRYICQKCTVQSGSSDKSLIDSLESLAIQSISHSTISSPPAFLLLEKLQHLQIYI